MGDAAPSVIASRVCGEAIQGCGSNAGAVALDCFVASLLAMTVFAGDADG
jgi:hypothetical protein